MIETEFLLTISIQSKHRRDENKVKYQLGDYWLIQCQFLQIVIGIVWQTVRRITNEILRVKGLKTLFRLGITKITKIAVYDSQLKRVVLKFVKFMFLQQSRLKNWEFYLPLFSHSRLGSFPFQCHLCWLGVCCPQVVGCLWYILRIKTM